MPFRLDTRGSVRHVTKTPQGGVRVDAALTRTGVLEYPGPNGTVIREYRPPDEVARADSLATLAHAPVTNRHPPGAVNPRNYKTYAVGTVAGEARMDGDLVVASLVIQDADALAAVETGKRREISCGYNCDLDETPGETPEGIRFDRVQRNIVYNHVAIVERGRAGSSVALRMDADGNLTIDEENMDPKEIAKLQADLAAAVARADKAEAARDAATARADAATARADAAEAKEQARADAADLEKAIVVARKVCGAEFKVDGLTLGQVRAAVAAKDSGLRLDGKSEAYVGALYDAAAARADKAEQLAPATKLREGLRQIPGGRQDGETSPARPGARKFRSAAQARADMLERSENAWRDEPAAK